MYICIKANAACITNWQKKREGGGKKTVYLFTTVKRQKNTKLLPRFPDNLSVLLKPC